MGFAFSDGEAFEDLVEKGKGKKETDGLTLRHSGEAERDNPLNATRAEQILNQARHPAVSYNREIVMPALFSKYSFSITN